MSNPFERYLGPEDRTHKAILDYLKLRYGRYLKFVAHPVNEGKRTPFERFKAKWLGINAGLPDILIFLPRGHYNGLAIEVKAKGNKPTEAQLKWLDSLNTHCGWMARWTYSIDEAMAIIDNYFDGEAKKPNGIPVTLIQ